MTTIEAPAPSTVPSVTRADVLHRAADLLEEFGWCQGTEGMPMGRETPRAPYCLLGSIAEARYDLGSAGGSEYHHAAAILLGDRDLVTLDSLHVLYSWNDEPGRTKAEVVARLRAAAEAS